MQDEIQHILDAKDWISYYSAFKRLYSTVLEKKWGLGKATYANHLHHSAIPDVSGTVSGTLRWAAYSQLSAETLAAFVKVFSTVITVEPQRIRSSRYLFFVPHGEPLSRTAVTAALGQLANKVDYSCDSLEEVLSLPDSYSPLDSLNALLADDRRTIDRGELSVSRTESDETDWLVNTRRHVRATSLPTRSTIPQLLQRSVIDSSFVLTAIRLNKPIEFVLKLCDEYVAIAAAIALQRVEGSGWGESAKEYCNDLIKACPPKSRTHIIAPGDMLGRIARAEYEMPFDSVWPLIKALNPSIKDPNRIKAGEKLLLPLMPPLS